MNVGKRKIRGKKLKAQRKFLLLGIMVLITLFTVGYATFQTTITINVKGNIYPRNNLYVSANGSDTNGRGTQDRPYATIAKAYSVAEASNSAINIMTDIVTDEKIVFDQNKKITLKSVSNHSYSIKRGQSLEVAILENTQGNLTLENITFDGENRNVNYSLISVENSKFTMNTGTILQNNIDTRDHGGGLRLKNSQVIINGGIIRNNVASGGGGGGIISNDTSLVINDGEISGNTATGGGGIVFKTADSTNNTIRTTLTINGGTIANNETTSGSGGGISVGNGSMLVLNDGTISGNTSINNGGGIYLTSTSAASLYGGTISGNTATQFGGGIYIKAGGIFTVDNENVSFQSNTPDDIKNMNS